MLWISKELIVFVYVRLQRISDELENCSYGIKGIDIGSKDRVGIFMIIEHLFNIVIANPVCYISACVIWIFIGALCS